MGKNNNEGRILKYSCNCINSVDDPWSYISRAGSLSSETRQIIINKTYKEPKTVTQLAKEIGLSQPAIHKHVVDLLREGLIKEAEILESKRVFKREKYYAPTFPVVLTSDLNIPEPILTKITEEIAEIIKKARNQLKISFDKTSLPKRKWVFEDLTFFLYKKIMDLTREKFEQQGFFPEIPLKNGEKWVFWAEEVDVEDNVNSF